MASVEIERKFVLNKPAADIISDAKEQNILLSMLEIEQRYLEDTGSWAIRIRKQSDSVTTRYFQTMKRQVSIATCDELEMEISQSYHDEIAKRCGTALRKQRAVIKADGSAHKWEIDIFQNDELAGIEIAEIELGHEEEAFLRPKWLGDEVTTDPRYRNAVMARLISMESPTSGNFP